MKTHDETADGTMPAAMAELDQMEKGQGPDTKATGSTEDCVPLDALAQPDEQEQMEPPQVGDRVSYTIEGRVTRIEGKMAYVAKEAVNGQPADSEHEPDADDAGGPSDNDADNTME